MDWRRRVVLVCLEDRHVASRRCRRVRAAGWVLRRRWLSVDQSEIVAHQYSAAATFLNQSGGPTYWQAATLAVLFMLAALPSCLPWLAFGAVLQRLLRSERALRTFNIGMGVLLAASVVVLVT